MTDDLPTLVAQVARELPPSVLDHLQRGLRNGTLRTRSDWASVGTSPRASQLLRLLFDRWQRDQPAASVESLAFGLSVASQSVQQQAPTAELVWSGPNSPAHDWRQTEPALLQVIQSAQHSLWLVTFAAYRVESLAQALAEAAARGVAIHFVAETRAGSQGRLSHDAARGLGGSLPASTQIYIWPDDKRLADGTRLGVLHAKCAVADARIALISSANLTGSAMHLNMEVGVLLHGAAPDRLERHLRALVASRVLERAD